MSISFKFSLTMETEIIQQHAGAVDKYIGDAIMAVFESKNAADNALTAAIEIQRYIEEHPEKFPLKIGIGIHVGDVVMGAIGHNDRLDFTVIGSAVNIASRLCGSAESGEIVVSADLFKLLDNSHEMSLDKVNIKGYKSSLEVYRFFPHGQT